MKNKPFLFFVIFSLFASCSRNNDLLSENEIVWKTIDFKTNYTIQVPKDFSGGLLQGFEGNSFYASSPDTKTRLSSGYSNSLFVFDFGDVLQNPIPKNIQVMNSNSRLVTLDQTTEFYQNSELAGILFYSNDINSRGRVYWKDNFVFKDALEIDFNLSDLKTIVRIIESIKKK